MVKARVRKRKFKVGMRVVVNIPWGQFEVGEGKGTVVSKNDASHYWLTEVQRVLSNKELTECIWVRWDNPKDHMAIQGFAPAHLMLLLSSELADEAR